MIYHYCNHTYSSGDFGGVARFDYELTTAIPTIKSINKSQLNLIAEGDIVITDNHLCLDIPDHIKCIAVHHGIAAIHKEREPTWPGDWFVRQQQLMSERPNTYFVSTSTFCTEAAKKYHNITPSAFIPHYSGLKQQERVKQKKIIGDWRDFNKGSRIIPLLRKQMPDFEFIDLKCGAFDKEGAYSQASIYLSLSLSEGCSYASLDALACGLPVISTDCGLFYKDIKPAASISYEDRDNLTRLEDKIRDVYDNYWFEKSTQYYYASLIHNPRVVELDEWTYKWTNCIEKTRSI